jgi:anti-sigma factor RsiW
MRLVRPFPESCELVREQLSLALDCELSQLEEARIDAHLASCAGCTTFRAELGTATRILRTAPLEQLTVSIMIPAHRRVARRITQVAAAAAVVVVAGIGSLGLANREAQRSAGPAFPTRAVRQIDDALAVDRTRRPGQMSNGFRGRFAR